MIHSEKRPHYALGKTYYLKYMPLLTAIFVNGIIFSVLYYINDVKIFDNIVESINLISFLIGASYAVASTFLGGFIRAFCGVALVCLSVIDLGLPEPANSIIHAVVTVAGALTPF